VGLTARQLAGPVLGVIGEPHPRQPGGGPGAGGTARRAPGSQPEGDVLESGEVREQQVVLEDHRHRASLRGHEHTADGVVEGLAVELDAAGIDGQQAGEAAKERGLAGAIGAEEGERLSGGHGDLGVEGEGAEGAGDAGVEGHARATSPPPPR
jgi:hypothetical protein